MTYPHVRSGERSRRKQRTRNAPRAASILAVTGGAALTGHAPGRAAPASAPAAQNLLGSASNGMPVQLDIHGKVMSRKSLLAAPRKFERG